MHRVFKWVISISSQKLEVNLNQKRLGISGINTPQFLFLSVLIKINHDSQLRKNQKIQS